MASEGQSGVLSRITRGSGLRFQFADSDQAIHVNEERVLVPAQGVGEEFYAVMYEFNGQNQAKITLARASDPRYSWNVVQEPNLENALMVSPEEGQFVLTENAEGLITISNTVSPPDPFVGVHQEPFLYLATGFTDAPEQCSRFAITISQEGEG
jgi:hypothetical protein